jgi:hypothetical protein
VNKTGKTALCTVFGLEGFQTFSVKFQVVFISGWTTKMLRLFRIQLQLGNATNNAGLDFERVSKSNQNVIQVSINVMLT